MKLNNFLFIILCLVNFKILAQEPEVVTIEETIRGNQEQPKVLTIVPWQQPSAKEALPSLIAERINKPFVPLQREAFLRELDVLRSKNTYPN